MHPDADVLDVDPVSGQRTGLANLARRALRALEDVPHALVGAAALAVRGLPRMTRDIDVVVLAEDAFDALDALRKAGFESTTPVKRDEEPEPMYVLQAASGGGEVDLLVAVGEPESTVVDEAPKARAFGVEAPVATLEHLMLMYLYSNQPRHLGDFARIVTDSEVDLGWVDSYLRDVHPEMLPTFRERVAAAQSPAPAPPRPPRRRSRKT
jgi:hypothetical protein